MNVILPPDILRKDSENRIFLDNLDKKYPDQKITIEEIEKVLSLIGKENHLVITPINTNRGFSVGFEVLCPGYKSRTTLLTFIEKQLSEGYDFNKISRTFNREDNIEMLVSSGLEKPKERRNYTY